MMTRCSACFRYTAPAAGRCEHCGVALPSSSDVAANNHAFSDLLKSRLGMRLVFMLIGLVVFGIWTLFKG